MDYGWSECGACSTSIRLRITIELFDRSTGGYSKLHRPPRQAGCRNRKNNNLLRTCIRAAGFKGYTKHAGGDYDKAHRRPHAYANVKDLRYLPISRPESLWALLAAQDRSDSEPIGVPFDSNYKAVLGIRALGHLEVYEFEELKEQ